MSSPQKCSLCKTIYNGNRSAMSVCPECRKTNQYWKLFAHVKKRIVKVCKKCGKIYSGNKKCDTVLCRDCYKKDYATRYYFSVTKAKRATHRKSVAI